MLTLVRILRAVHCRSTHHFFAIDALDRIQTPNGRRLASVLLAHYEAYLNGAKAPDAKFKDFQNHVIHVGDNQWGGAPQACETWLARVIEHMHDSDWKAAAFAIGVLSHYFTDPLMPLHTAQHPAEAVVHRPLEWSVCKAYDSILRKCSNQVTFSLDNGPQWISRAVLAGAAIAHKQYMPLIDLYDLKKGIADPPKGLNSQARVILAELFDYALTGWARILERIAIMAMIEIPIFTLTMPTLMAAVDVPVAWVVNRLSDASEKRAVKAIFEEFKATGQVVRNVPAEVRVVARAKPPTLLPKFITPAKAGATIKENLQPLIQDFARAVATPEVIEAASITSELPREVRSVEPETAPVPHSPESTHTQQVSRVARVTLDSRNRQMDSELR